MRITKISQQKRSSRVNIYLDDEFAFGISKKTLVDFDLFVGKEIFREEIDKILEKDQRVKALEKSFRLLGMRQRSQKELEKKLKEKCFDEKIIKDTIKRVKELGYLDDKKFAQAWLEARKTMGKGKFIVKRELKEKGIKEETIEKTLRRYSKKDEFKTALKLVEKKKRVCGKLPFFEKKIKISRYLAGRGFSWEIINQVLKFK